MVKVGEGANGRLYEYYHEISLTPLLGMFKCGNFPLDRHNDMIWRHDTDTCMQSTSWRHRPIISTSLQPWPGITELSPDYLISSTGSRHEAMRPPLPFIFLAYVSCVVYSTEVNIHRGDLNNLVIHIASDASSARSGSAVYSTPCRASQRRSAPPFTIGNILYMEHCNCRCA